jgi:DNA-binding YbaB/EbfC family protein
MKLPKNFGMGGLGDLMRQAKEAMEKSQQLEKELAEQRLAIDKGPIKAEFTGKGEIQSIKIDASIVDPSDVESLEDLVVATMREGYQRVEENRAKKMKGILPEGMPGMPGF